MKLGNPLCLFVLRELPLTLIFCRYIDFADGNLKDEEIEKLVEASEKATFGRNSEDVLDESYRKAWKMDASQFAIQFDVVKSGILDIVHDQLLRYEKNTESLYAHLYKLNVYGTLPFLIVLTRLSITYARKGPGSFFKPHIDTPRSDKLFATLVIVLPTIHEGGNLLLGEDGKLLNFDSAKQVYDPESKTPRVAFVAFYSDIEHQVLPVESGYRVTVTYNLHLTQSSGVNAMLKTIRTESFDALTNSFASAIASPTILPKGGALGFGLVYRYPINPKTTNLGAFTGALKGNDALIRAVCEDLGLEPSVKILYEKSYSGADEYLADKVVNGAKISDPYGDFSSRSLWRRVGATRIVDPGEQPSPSYQVPVLWITPPSKMVTTDLAYLTYGNEAILNYAYGDLVLIAKFPAYRERVEHLKNRFSETLSAKILADIDKSLNEL